MAKTMQCGPLTRSFNVTRADAVEGDDMRIQVEFSSEEPVSRSFGLEVLDHSPKSVRLARLNDGAPFLLDHRSGFGNRIDCFFSLIMFDFGFDIA